MALSHPKQRHAFLFLSIMTPSSCSTSAARRVTTMMVILILAGPAMAQKKQHADSISLKQLEKTDLIDFAALALRLGDKGKVSRPGDEGTVHFSVIPVAPSSSGQGKIAVSAINASFYLGKETNISSIYFSPYTNFATSYGITLTPYIWFNKNDWNGTGDFRIIHNSLRDYGLGGSASTAQPTEINYSQIRTYLTAHTRIIGNFYLGAGYNLDYFYSIREEDPTPTSPSDFSNSGSTAKDIVSSGITANILRDSRKNSVNPTQGYYTAVVVRVNKKSMGSTYDWSSLYVDGRKYYSFSDSRHKVMAVRAFYWGTFGDVPYLNMPATFEDPGGRAGRGYNLDRFRGKHMLFAEAEYRFDISSHGFLGAVLFANVQSYTDNKNNFDYIRPAAGFGFRFKFNRHSNTNLTLDFAFGREGLNWYINLGEYF